jgi:hypothetical protein
VTRSEPTPARVAPNFVLVIGIANLFADLTYEGARSINGQFLASLGASALAVGFTARVGELLGYGLRSITGLISDRTGQYWLVTITGYLVNMAAVPAMALSPTLIPIYYAVAMGAGAVGALALGRLHDMNQAGTVLGTFLAAAFFAPLVFLGGPRIALGGMVLWGIGLAAQESLLRSVVAGIVDASSRATAFGLFDTGFGIAWFIGSVVMGYRYGISIAGLVIFSVLLELIGLPLLAFAGAENWRNGSNA